VTEGNLFADFFSVTGFDEYDQMRRPADQKRSLDGHTLEFLRRFYAHVPLFTDSLINPDRGVIAEPLAGILTGEHLKPSWKAANAFMDSSRCRTPRWCANTLHHPDGALFARVFR
jgi:hypothetical protein